jgi:hypothetical protein
MRYHVQWENTVIHSLLEINVHCNIIIGILLMLNEFVMSSS